MASSKSVPIIDMADVETLPGKLVRACEELGCFRLKNHGIETQMAEMKAVARDLLDLPLELKMKNFNSDEPGKGYTPSHPLSPFRDGLSLYDMESTDSVRSFCDQMDVSPHQREVVSKYVSAMNDLVRVMGSKLIEGLGIAGVNFGGGINHLKMNKYHFTPDKVGLKGAKLHTDVGLFTILQDDEDVNGLEVMDETTGELISVDPVPGTLVFNVGDAGKVWSNGRFCSAKHQVHCYKPKARYTNVLFVYPPKDEKVKVLEQLVTPQIPALYIPFDFEHYRSLRISTGLQSVEVLESFRAPGQLKGLS